MIEIGFSYDVAVATVQAERLYSSCSMGSSTMKGNQQQLRYRDSTNTLRQIPTNAFGTIEFQFATTNSYQRTAKFIKLDEGLAPDTVLSFMADYWKMPPPDLVIFMVAGEKQFQKASNKNATVCKDLMKAIKATRGWIFTFGNNCGMAKAVGAALVDEQTFEVVNDELVNNIQCVGITPFTEIRNNDRLTSDGTLQKINATFFADSEGERHSLEPNHSHFILVDSGHTNKKIGTDQFRKRLKMEVSRKYKDIPLVTVLVEGGTYSAQCVRDDLLNDLPVIVCKDTGGAADVMSDLYSQICSLRNMTDPGEKETAKTTLNEWLIERLTRLKGTNDKLVESKESLVDTLAQVFLDKHNLIHVFDNSSGEDFCAAVLLCLSDPSGDNVSLARLKLTQTWNRADLAQKVVLTSDQPMSDRECLNDPAKFHNLFLSNVIEDRVEFVKLFIDKGFNLYSNFTESLLGSLYRSTIGKRPSVWQLIGKQQHLPSIKELTLAHMQKFLETNCCNRYRGAMYSSVTNVGSEHGRTFDDPFNELFIWSVIMGRLDMTIYFWEHCKQPLLTGISGTLICFKLLPKLPKEFVPDQKEYNQINTELEKNCVGLLDTMFGIDSSGADLTQKILGAPNSAWDGLRILDLAGSAYDCDFIATEACQHSIYAAWKEGLVGAKGFPVFVATFTVFFAPYLLSFSPKVTRKSARSEPEKMPLNAAAPINPPSVVRQRSSVKFDNSGVKQTVSVHLPTPTISSTESKESSSYWYQTYTFYNSPIAKFTLHMGSYFVFLVLYAYVSLFSFTLQLTKAEIFVHCWIFTLICDEIRSLIQCPHRGLKQKLQSYWEFSTFGSWIAVDILAMLLDICAIVLRCFTFTFAIGRFIFAVNFIIFISRSLEVFFVNRYLGPKVYMIKEMMYHTFMLSLFILIFLVSYSVTSLSLLDPNRTFKWGISYDIFNHGIWEIFGEIIDESTSRDHFVNCTQDSIDTLPFECYLRWYPVPILLVLYLFAGNILMINMLIATFTHVFDQVQVHSQRIWKYEMHFLMEEYKEKPFLPPPLIIISDAWLLLSSLWLSITRSPKKIKAKKSDKIKFLSTFERLNRRDYLYNRAQRK